MSCLTPVYTNCVTFSIGFKEKLKALGYTAESFEDLILEIISKGGGQALSEVRKLADEVKNLSVDTLPANAKLYGLKTGSTDAARVTARSVGVTVLGGELAYDFGAVKTGLPEDMSYINARVDVVDNEGRKTSVRGAANVLRELSFPADVHLSMDVKTPNGLLTMERQVRVEGDIEKDMTLNIKDFTNAPADLSMKQFMETLAAEVAVLKSRVK